MSPSHIPEVVPLMPTLIPHDLSNWILDRHSDLQEAMSAGDVKQVLELTFLQSRHTTARELQTCASKPHTARNLGLPPFPLIVPPLCCLLMKPFWDESVFYHQFAFCKEPLSSWFAGRIRNLLFFLGRKDSVLP